MHEQEFQPPPENINQGIIEVDIPELGPRYQGKVRDNWVQDRLRVIVTTDRTSAYDSVICTIEDKGSASHLLSSSMFDETRHIFPNHLVAVPHPNVSIVRQAEQAILVEVVARDFMAKAATKTSLYHNYVNENRRVIYGIEFPDGLRANEKLPMGVVITPTTKGKKIEELTIDQARRLVDEQTKPGTWDRIEDGAKRIFAFGQAYAEDKSLLLVDTKFEFGFIEGELVLIDELFSADSSRFWMADTYQERFAAGEQPDTFDKEILRRWLAGEGYTGKGPIPVVPPNMLDQMSEVNRSIFEILTGKKFVTRSSNVDEIRQAALDWMRAEAAYI